MSSQLVCSHHHARHVTVTLKYDNSATGGGMFVSFDQILTRRGENFMVFAHEGYQPNAADTPLLAAVLEGLLDMYSGVRHVSVTETALIMYNDHNTDGAYVIDWLKRVLLQADYRVDYTSEVH